METSDTSLHDLYADLESILGASSDGLTEAEVAILRYEKTASSQLEGPEQLMLGRVANALFEVSMIQDSVYEFFARDRLDD